MLYHLLRPVIHFAFKVNFRKVYFLGWKNFPKKKIPTLVALNHPTSFLDPIYIAGNALPVFHFLLRGDMFRSSKIVQWALRSMNTIPIFRSREGFEGLRKNQAIFEYVNTLWNKNKNVMILVEGETKHEKRLRPIQKGPARMALSFYEKFKKEDFAFVPVGVNYTDSDKFRSYATIEFGEPFYLSEYKEAIEENDRKAVRLITERIKKEMRKLVIHIEDKEDDEFVNALLDINRNNLNIPIFPIVERRNNDLVKSEYNMVEHINGMEGEEKEALKNKTIDYINILKQNKLEDIGVKNPDKANLVNSIKLILGFIPYLIGYAFNSLPLIIARNFANKKVKKIEFNASVRVAVGMVLYFIYFLIWLISLLIIGNWWLIGGLFFLTFILSRFSLIYFDFKNEYQQAKIYGRLSEEMKNQLNQLRKDLTQAIATT